MATPAIVGFAFRDQRSTRLSPACGAYMACGTPSHRHKRSRHWIARERLSAVAAQRRNPILGDFRSGSIRLHRHCIGSVVYRWRYAWNSSTAGFINWHQVADSRQDAMGGMEQSRRIRAADYPYRLSQSAVGVRKRQHCRARGMSQPVAQEADGAFHLRRTCGDLCLRADLHRPPAIPPPIITRLIVGARDSDLRRLRLRSSCANSPARG